MNSRRLIGLVATVAGALLLLIQFLLPMIDPQAAYFLGLQPPTDPSDALPMMLGWNTALFGTGLALLIRDLKTSAMSWVLLMLGIGGIGFWVFVLNRGVSHGFPVKWSVRPTYGGTMTTIIPFDRVTIGFMAWLIMLVVTISRAVTAKAVMLEQPESNLERRGSDPAPDWMGAANKGAK
jgi:hypothetical protein